LSILHQALHGYRDGHRLLASSIELSAADRQRIAVQTDNSDAGRSGDWEGLIAGYPLPSGLYAWSMTWLAPEMPRPGSVWSHTLIINPAAPPFERAGDVLACFRRPNLEVNPSVYTRPITPPASPGDGETTKCEPGLIRALVWALYEPPISPVRLTGVTWSDDKRHTLLLSLWLQQWGSLRAVTSFTDAPSTPRRLDDRIPYDLQLQGSHRAQQREQGERVVSGVPSEPPPSWAAAVARDLQEPGALGCFLAAYGPEAGGERSALSALSVIWEHAVAEADAKSIGAAIAILVELFPAVAAGERLKHDLLAPRSQLLGTSASISDATILTALLRSGGLRHLPLDAVEVPKRVRAVLRNDPSLVASILSAIESEPGPLGEEILNALADAPAKSLERWLGADPDSLAGVLSKRPEVAGAAQLWARIDADLLWRAVAGFKGRARRRLILAAIIESEARVNEALILETWHGSESAVLELLSAGAAKDGAAKRWLKALPPRDVADWVSAKRSGASDSFIRFVVSTIEPHELCRLEPDLVLEQLEASRSQNLVAKAFLAAISSSLHSGWAPVAIASYERIAKPRNDKVSSELSRSLVRLDPGLKDTAVGDRSARALNLAFQDDCWDPLLTLRLPRGAFNRLIAADRKAGLARRILAAVQEEPDACKPWQIEALLRNVDERADKAGVFGLLKRIIGL
jgi:GTPase-associated protein 1, N-terminal domain type 1